MAINPIVLPGIGPNAPPGVYAQEQFAQGVPSIGNTKYAAIILANMNQSVGTAGVDGYVYGPDTLVPMLSSQDAISLFGDGSPAYRMVAAFLKVNQGTPLYVAPVKASTGSAASLNIVISGSVTGSGTIRCNIVGDPPVDTPFLSGVDNATSIAAAMAVNINSQTHLPVTATASSGTLTITAKVAGARGNWLRASARVLAGSGITSSVVKPTFFTGGTGSDSYTNVLNFLAANGIRYYYYICECGADSVDGYVGGSFAGTQVAAVQTQIDNLAQPVIGIVQKAFFGSSDTLGNTTNVTTNMNDARCEVAFLQNSDTVPSELATNCAAVYSLFETPPLTAGSINYDGFGNDPGSAPFWNAVYAPLDGSAPSSTTIQSCVVSGITALKVERGGRTSIVKRITSRFLSGSVNDFRITDAGKVTITDFFTDDLKSLVKLRFPRKLVANDPVQGQSPPTANVVTPSMVKNVVIELANQYASAGLINGPQVIQNLVVQREANPSSRISIMCPLFTSDPLHTVVMQINQVS